MGSFNSACIVSGLPIEAGDKVRFLVLARSAISPDGNDHPHYVDGRWQLFGVPVRAEYDDYGSVENVEDGYAKSFLFSCLRAHSVEVGVGDNQCHDVEVVEDMDEEDWLMALWEGRINIRECHPRSADGKSTWEPTVGIPTFKRVKKVLEGVGHTVRSGDGTAPLVDGFLVDDTTHGFVRVRAGGYGNDFDVASLLPSLHEAGYAAMVVAGSGSYAKESEILVGPLPPKDPNVHVHVRPYGSGDKDVPHTVAVRPASQAMIREDVWQILLSLPGWTDKSVEDIKEAALAAFEEDKREDEEDRAAKGDPEKALERARRKTDRFLDRSTEVDVNFFRGVVRGGIGTLGFGLKSAFDAARDPSLDPEKARKFVQDIAETAFAQFAYGSIHGQWQPRSGGGQDPNWAGFHGYLQKLVEIARAKHDREVFGDEDEVFDDGHEDEDEDEDEDEALK